jgi:hypothetical protein
VSYQVYRSDGIPLADYPSLLVCRDGRFIKIDYPQINDVFTIQVKNQEVTYHVGRVDGNRAYTTKVLIKDRR